MKYRDAKEISTALKQQVIIVIKHYAAFEALVWQTNVRVGQTHKLRSMRPVLAIRLSYKT